MCDKNGNPKCGGKGKCCQAFKEKADAPAPVAPAAEGETPAKKCCHAKDKKPDAPKT